MTNTVPNKYQGVLCPSFVLVLSESIPTTGVAIPSNIYPPSREKGAT